MEEQNWQKRELSKMSAHDFLMAKYQERIATLQGEENKLEGHLAQLLRTRAELGPVSEAKVRVLSGKYDVALSRGKASEADKKNEEIETVKQHSADINRGVEQASTRLQEIAEEKKKIANSVFTELYPEIQAFCFHAIEALIDLLDATFAGLQEFSQETGARLSGYHRRNLIPPPLGKTRFLLDRLSKWF